MEEIKEAEITASKGSTSKIDVNTYRSIGKVEFDNSKSKDEFIKWFDHPITKCLIKQLKDYADFVNSNSSFPRILFDISTITGKIVNLNMFVRKPQIDDFVEYGLIKATDINGNEITEKSNLTKDDNEFYLTFDSPYFYEGEYISNGYGSNHSFRVISNPLLKDGRYIYKVRRSIESDSPVFYYDLTPGSGFTIEKCIFETDL